ncbi:VanZ family protein [Streptomyces sp. ISL-11]|uniref:VanZ family protein n=1 Tax=Streptomyces sp. ISL-11 TaxID=2819174 RepID=UPI001BEA01CB|nr:VanZ family protein [Streptomyces sp. ISL-11]MBT2385726.1 VanZ family protein [Streptomyces sp. ISL-11]
MQGHGYGGTPALRYRYRFAGCVLLVAHLLAVGWLALRPLTAPWVAAAHLEPLATIRADLALGPWGAARAIGAAVLPLAPLGVLLPWARGRVCASSLGSLTRTVFTAAMISLVLQVVQSGVMGQVLNLDALLLNVTGVALAHLAVVPAVRARLRRGGDGGRPEPLRREEEMPGMTPTIPRVRIAP